MKRSDFLKKIGMGIGMAIVAPKILAGTSIKEDDDMYPSGTLTMKDMETAKRMLEYPLTPRECCKYCFGDIFNFNGGEYMITGVPYFPGETDYRLTPLNILTNNGQSIFVEQGALDDAFIRIR